MLGLGSRERLLVLALVAAFVLHSVSTSLQSSGDGTFASMFTTQDREGNPEAVAALVERRRSLETDLVRLEATLKELSHLSEQNVAQLGLPQATSEAGGQNVAQPPPPSPSFRGSLPQAPATLPVDLAPPAVPPAVPDVPPPAVDVAAPVPAALPVPVPVSPVIVPPPAAHVPPQLQLQVPPQPPATAAAEHRTAGGSVFFFSNEAAPPDLVDFPCPLRELKKAQVTTTCELACRDDTCERAKAQCDGYVECTHLFIKAPFNGQGTGLASATAVLKHDSTARTDDSLQRLQVSRWWSSPAMTAQTKPRIYIVASYGGCGSKMFAGWLWSLPSAVKQHVYHFHDRQPPSQLREIPKPPPPVYGRGGKADFRSGRFPGGSRFKTDTAPIADRNLDDYRVIYLYKDPVEAMVSRYGFGHCNHIQGDCGPSEQAWPRLDQYAKAGKDRMMLNAHFNAFMRPQQPRNYPVIAINYHKLWDNLPAVMSALGLPQDFVGKFPPRTETVRNDLTGAAERNAAHTEQTRQGLKQMYSSIVQDIATNPAVVVV